MIEKIMGNVGFNDLLSFSSTCKTFHSMKRTNRYFQNSLLIQVNTASQFRCFFDSRNAFNYKVIKNLALSYIDIADNDSKCFEEIAKNIVSLTCKACNLRFIKQTISLCTNLKELQITNMKRECLTEISLLKFPFLEKLSLPCYSNFTIKKFCENAPNLKNVEKNFHIAYEFTQKMHNNWNKEIDTAQKNNAQLIDYADDSKDTLTLANMLYMHSKLKLESSFALEYSVPAVEIFFDKLQINPLHTKELRVKSTGFYDPPLVKFEADKFVPNIEILDLSEADCNLYLLTGLCKLTNLRKLKIINMAHDGFNEIKGLPNLTELILSFTEDFPSFKYEYVNELYKLQKLDSLDLFLQHYSFINIHLVLGLMQRSLKELTLRFCHKMPLQLLIHALNVGHKSLKKLELQHCSFINLPLRSNRLELLELETLRIYHVLPCYIGAAFRDNDFLQICNSCPSLVDISLSNMKNITDAALPNVKNLHRLRRISLSGTSVTSDDIQLSKNWNCAVNTNYLHSRKI